MDKITIDRKALLALASETRIEILKKLDSRRMTLSELSEEFGMSKAAVKEHLDKLVEAGLIKRVDEGRKWIYYELTKKGKGVLHPESKRIIFLLSSATASIVGGLFELYKFFSLTKPVLTVEKAARIPIATPAPTPAPETVKITPTPLPTPTPVPASKLAKAIQPEVHLLAGLALILIGVSLLLYLFIARRR